MPLVFHPNEIRIFDRAGQPLGSVTGFSVSQPRSYRLNEIEDFAFVVPREDQASGEVYLTSTVVNTLLQEDNLVYVENQIYGMRGWAGSIRDVTYSNGEAQVAVVGAMDLLQDLSTELITQDDGYAWTIASRLLSAAQARQAPHGDIVVDFTLDETPGSERRNYGRFTYEGDILAGIQGLAQRVLSECYIEATIRTDGSLRLTFHWGGQYAVDHTDIVIHDGPGGSMMPGNQIKYSSTSAVNHARLRGETTELARYVDYDSVRGVLLDVTPECEISLDTASDFHRRREQLDLSVGFGYSVETQKALAAQIQELYLGYYKTFLYAYHHRQGKPFLDGYDWAGPNGRNDKRLTQHFGRTYSRLAYIGHRTVLVGDADDNDETTTEAELTDWQYDQTITPVATCVGIATDWTNTEAKWVADGSTGQIYQLDDDLATLDLWLKVTGSGETLKSIATDTSRATVLWVLVTTASAAIVRAYDTDDQVVLYEWSVAVPTANDIAVDAVNGVLWLVATDGVGNVQARDINSGVLLTSGDYQSFASGFANPVGLSVSGGLAYIVDASGNMRMLFNDDGNYAGEKATGVSLSGVFADLSGGLMWLVKADGSLALYRAHIAVANAGGAGIVEGAPGFENITAGQFVHVVFDSRSAATPHSKKKLFVCYAKGKYVTSAIPGAPGEADTLQRTWVTGTQKVAWIKRKKVHWTTSEQVVQGEESRVDDWDPEQDGYGYYGGAVYQTAAGHTIRYHKGWFPKDWDVPESSFQPDAPEWTEGLAYLQDYMARANARRPTQVLNVTNQGDLFKKIELGGKYTVNVTRQGPPGGFTGTLRVLAYTPDERQGTMELIGEWV